MKFPLKVQREASHIANDDIDIPHHALYEFLPYLIGRFENKYAISGPPDPVVVHSWYVGFLNVCNYFDVSIADSPPHEKKNY